jgi:hypothetical protein
MSMSGIYTMAANSYFDIQLYNATGANVVLTATSPNSYFHIYIYISHWMIDIIMIIVFIIIIRSCIN